MFGNSSISTTWGQPQQNQQQPQQGTPGFGQPAANAGFGAGTFGAGGAFGQQQPQQPQQQPQANPMFGGLGGQTNNTTATPGNTGFGAFGQNNATTANAGLFGAPKPATGGFGAFGGTGGTGTTTFGGATGTFGTPAGATTGTGLFGGQNTTTTNTFGGTGGMFGQAKPATTAFGTPTTATGTDAVAPVTTGSSNPTYQAFSEKDPANSSAVLHYQSISCMPAYRGTSFEELRWQDYSQGRKTAGAFGQTFGAPAAQPATNTGLFGQTAATNPAQPANNVFGGFGSTNATNPAGTNTTGAFGTFGQAAAGTTNTTTGGLFGGGNAFGQQQPQQPQQQQTTGFGTFGQTQQPQQQNQAAGGGLFGGGAFGTQANQPKPFGTFGTTNTNTAGTSTGFGTFGQTNQNQPAAAGAGLFGQTQPQQQQQPQQTTGFSTFGQNNQPKPGLFGQAAQPTTNTFGGFGTQNQTQPNQTGTQPAGGLFGNTGATGGNLFGNTQQNQQPGQQQQPTGGLFGNQTTQQPTGGLFGNTNNANTGGLFGNTQPQQNPAQPATGGFGLFGPKPANTTPATGGLFGGGFGQQNANNAGQPQQQPGGLFGQQQQTTQPANNTFNLFGAKPATSTQPQSAAGGFGGSLFGGGLGTSTAPAGQIAPQQPTLTASIAQPIGANLPIFSMFPPGPRAINLDQPKKKSGIFLDVPTRTPVPRLQLGYTPATSKLRGFTSTSTSPGQPFSGSISLTNGKPGALSLSKAANQKSLLGPDAILNGSSSTPGLGSGGRQSVKKLILDRKVEPSELFGRLKASQPKVTFNPALSIASRELDAAAAVQRVEPASKTTAKGKFSAQGSNDSVAKDGEKAPEPAELKEGDYYVRPSLDDLKKRSFGELASTEGLVVGRVGYGEIQFLEPVDLTGLQRTTELLGDVVRFDDKECSVYPDLDDADKPPPGSGLNVAARIMLVNCWALDKATREPIKDASHAGAMRHLKRLKNMKGTHFESFDIDEGKWVFTVEHF